MFVKTKYMVIEYSKDDQGYIGELINNLGNISQKIVDFFDINEITVNVKLFNSLDLFRKKFWEIFCYRCHDWTCGYAYYKNGYYIDTLNLSEYKKTLYHELDDINDLSFLILHEFVHSCHQMFTKNKLYVWLKEGLATYLSQQYSKYKAEMINCNLDNIINGGCSYSNYYLLFKYVIENYGKSYIIELLKDVQLMINDTPKLFDEAKIFYMSK